MDDFLNPGLSWSFSQCWNDALEAKEERPLKPRNNIWASELGGSYLDRILKMRGTPPSNPFSARAKRKFEAGNLCEWIVERVLIRAGLLLENQEWLSYQYPGLCEVTGKLDFFAGGNPDWAKALEHTDKMRLPEFFKRGVEAIILYLRDKYPNGLEKIVLEIKSCSSFMYERYDATGPQKGHELQIYHYLKAKNIREGHLVYISKDDLRMAEFGVRLGSERLEKAYREDIETITSHIHDNTTPEKEKLISFNESSGLFETNWHITYSPYLTNLYAFKEPSEYEDKYRPMVQRFNRVLKRIAHGDKMTKKNEEAITEMQENFNGTWDAMIEIAKAKLADVPEEKEEVAE